ncbi:type 4b pilus protein PilO2 [Cronobacter sakazakii]|uniref:Conjugal transfer protein n=1 Tax=Cronobacter sakazakii TaxID=28141 RepID=A0AA44Z6I0_CROSK|nr:type 4b pilus protein PilO2 [Cronobacter sakazakii]PUW01536.1 conjugal transfer protein [Cronobacter sakazakii]
MKKNTKQPASTHTAGNIHVLTFNQRRFVTGLTWQTIKAQRNPMKEIRRVGKERGLDLVAVRRSDSIQAGFAPKTRLRLRGTYSLTVALASLLEGCCIIVIALGQSATGEAQYTLVGKTERGGIHIWSDKVFLAGQLRQTIIDLREDLRGSKGTLNVPVYGDPDIAEVTDALDLEALLTPKNLSKDFRLKPLTMGMTREQLIAAGVAVAIGLCAVAWWRYVENEREAASRAALQREMLRQAELNKEARYKAALASFGHPWIDKPSVTTFISQCQNVISKVPISINGWMSNLILCTEQGVSVQSIRRTNSAATTSGYVAAVKGLFGVTPVFSFADSSQTSFSLPHKLRPEGDDPMIPANERLMALISRFQALNVDLSITAVPITDVKQNSEGETLPLQDWQEYRFSAETDVPPRDIFTGAAFTGIRLSEITLAVNTSDGSVRYKISGSLYGKR